MPASDVAERPESPNLHQNSAFRISPQRHARFEDDVRPGLQSGFPFMDRIVDPQEFILEPDLVIASKEDKNGLRVLHGNF